MKKHCLLFVCILLVLPLWVSAQDLDDLPPVTRAYALTKATVIQKPGEKMEDATVLVRNGLIEAIGKNLSIPPDAKVIDADSMFVYPGFIDGFSRTGISRPDNEDSGQRPEYDDPNYPPNEVAGITPNALAREVLDPKENSIGNMRELGFTIAHVGPHGRMLPGQGALIVLVGDEVEDMLLRDQTAMIAQFVPASRGVYPGTVVSVMSKFMELYKNAELTQAYAKKYKENPAGLARPSSDPVYRAFDPIIDREMPVFYVAEGLREVHRALDLQEDLGFDLVLANVQQGWVAMDRIKSQGAAVLLSLELPDRPKEEKKKGDDEASGEEVTDPEMEMLEKRRMEAMQQYEGQAAEYAERGIPFAFSTLSAKAGDIRANLRRMIEAGLSEEHALSALTTYPAHMLGLDKVAGTLETGKMANLVITDKPYFEEASKVRMVMVDGHLFKFEAKEKKASDPAAIGKVAGTWSYTINVPGNTVSGTFEFKDAGGSLDGTMSSDMGSQDLSGVAVEGKNITFATSVDYGGQSMNLDFDLTIDGDTINGTVQVANFGEFEVTGSRQKGPE